MTKPSWWRLNVTRLVALAAIFCLYAAAQLPEPGPSERQALAARFRFTALPMPELNGYTMRSVRAVNPSLQHISAWISAVGAGVALNDLDGDGLPNDMCLVDPRTDKVMVAPVPGTGDRYRPFVLDPAPLPYDAATTAPMGCLPGDFNEDGRIDLLVYYWGRTPIIFLNEAGGYRPVELVAGGARWFTNAATLADLDGDGHPDLIIGNYFPDGARILDANAAEPDDMQHSMSRAYNGGTLHFFLWAGREPRFLEADAGLDRDAMQGWTLAIGAADLDGDLLPELYIAHDFGPDRLLHNRSSPGRLRFAVLEGRKTFTTPSSKVLGRDSFKGMGVDFADLNGDGLLDIYVSNIAAEYALEESHFVFVSTGDVAAMQRGRAPYVDRSEPLGLSRSDWAWEARLADFDNDGVAEALQATGFTKGEVNRWPELQELAIGNDELLRHPRAWPRFGPGDKLSGDAHLPFFVRSASGRYVDLSRELGLDAAQLSRGIAVADVDGDGALDFAVARQWEPSVFYHNDCPRCHAFLGLHVLVPLADQQPAATRVRPGHPGRDTPGRPAIGAAARVSLPDGRVLVAQVDGGNGHSGKRSNDLHFGLGGAGPGASIHVELRWRDAKGQVRQEALKLSPGWHTVVLAAPVELAKAGGARP